MKINKKKKNIAIASTNIDTSLQLNQRNKNRTKKTKENTSDITQKR